MKKKILVGLFILSIMVLAHPTNMQGTPRYSRHFEYFHHDSLRIGKAFDYLPSSLQKEFNLTNLNIEEKEITVKKLLLEERIDWAKISELNREIAILRADLKTKLQQYFIENPITEPIKYRPLGNNQNNFCIEPERIPTKKL